MEIEVQSLAQRKAARKKQWLLQPEQPAPGSAPGIPVQTQPVQPAKESTSAETGSFSQTLPVAKDQISTEAKVELADAPYFEPKTLQNLQPAAAAISQSRVSQELDRDSLIALAQKLGLELREPKKIWIKHSFSITPQTKEEFQNRCRALGYKMQDALEEIMQDWFKKTESEFQAIHHAKHISD